jgi:hypothetical protein
VFCLPVLQFCIRKEEEEEMTFWLFKIAAQEQDLPGTEGGKGERVGEGGKGEK